MIKIYEPFEIESSADSIKKVILESRLTYQNEEHEKLSINLEQIFANKRVLPVANGTCAAHLAYKALKNKLKNLRKIIVPNNVYVAAWNSLLLDNDNIELIPIDADVNTWCVNLNLLKDKIRESDPEETAVLIVHNVSSIINVPKLKREFPNFTFLEDNCEGFTGLYEGQQTGTASFASSISFYVNKTITCSEGGATLLDQESYETIKKIYSQGQTSEKYVHDILAVNYRLTNIQAVLLLNQLEKLKKIKDLKKKIFDFYQKNLNPAFVRQTTEENTSYSNWMYAVRLNGSNYKRDIESTFNKSFETRPLFYPMSSHSHLRKFSNIECEKIAKLISKECFMIPSHPNLDEKNLNEIVKKMNSLCE